MSTSYVHLTECPRNQSLVDQKPAWGKTASGVFNCSHSRLTYSARLILFCRAWGKWAGPADNIYSVMKYEHGTGCWQGPNRATTVSLINDQVFLSTRFHCPGIKPFWGGGVSQVSLICGKETAVTSTSEPSRCEYLMEFTTPAACPEPLSPDSLYPPMHTEL